MKKLIKVAVQMDPLDSINIKTDSTYIICIEAQRRGYKLFHYLPSDMSVVGNKVYAKGSYFNLFQHSKNFFKKHKFQTVDLNSFNFILIRQDPPFNINYITSTYLLDMVKRPIILNNPKSIRDNSEKLSMLNFKDLIPPTIITKDIKEFIKFQKTYRNTIIKPLYGNGGYGIEKISGFKKNQIKKFSRLIDKLNQPIVVQKFLPEIRFGDRRIVLINGNYVGSVARIPKKGKITANFHTGGTAKKTSLIKRDSKICKVLGPFLKKNKLFFAGIDVIGNYLTEINVTSPTGIQEINRLNNCSIEKIFWDKATAMLGRGN